MKRNRNFLCIISCLLILTCILSGCTFSAVPGTAAAAEGSKSGVSPAPSDSTEKVELLVSAAASLTDVAADLTELYKKTNPNISLKFTFGSSGALETQIEEGAPADVFMSAALKQMDTLEKKGLLLDGTKKELLVNKVVLVSPKDSGNQITSFNDAASDKVSKIALGEPESVPVGQYAQEVFTTLGIWDKVKAKANFGSDVRQVLTWVENGEVDCGVVYATDAAASGKVKVICEAPKDSHKPVIYPVGVIKSSSHMQEALSFSDFLSTPQAAEIFKKYGFEMK
ncbi:MAG TPA: molybdate ABC transporter substrate-binding protein [Ruminiclostridium sp.]|nr:molybdate ABC transporter substrate-binding protein [Ruminiclostridium sp.]